MLLPVCVNVSCRCSWYVSCGICGISVVHVMFCLGFTEMSILMKIYIFTLADGGNSNKMRNFVS